MPNTDLRRSIVVDLNLFLLILLWNFGRSSEISRDPLGSLCLRSLEIRDHWQSLEILNYQRSEIYPKFQIYVDLHKSKLFYFGIHFFYQNFKLFVAFWYATHSIFFLATVKKHLQKKIIFFLKSISHFAPLSINSRGYVTLSIN